MKTFFPTFFLLGLLFSCTNTQAASTVFRDNFAEYPGQQGPTMVMLAGGSTMLGDTPYLVHMSPFAIGRDDVTNGEFAVFLSARGKAVDDDGIDYFSPRDVTELEIIQQGNRFIPLIGKEQLPVTGVSWRGALDYANWLSQGTGKKYFLPTEAQWEYAARGGSTTRWPWGNKFDASQASCNLVTTVTSPRPVGSFPPNNFGLHDMVGNVWQWMADCSPDDLTKLGSENPSGFDASCVTPSIRGGASANAPEQCRPGFRANYWWRGTPVFLGFRVVRLDQEKS